MAFQKRKTAKTTVEGEPTGAGCRKRSRFMGVFWDSARAKWTVRIAAHGKYRSVGRFDDEIEAARAYDEAARPLHGVFARMNLPTQAEREAAAGWVDRQEACRMFDISLPAWKRWERRGLVRGVRTSYRVFYNVAELKQVMPYMGPIEPPYPDPDRPGCYRVPLTGRGPRRRQGSEAIIDAESLPVVEGRRICWCGCRGPGGGYVSLSFGAEPTPLHRVIMNITDAEFQVGHRNGDPLDCRRENLVVRTVQERLWSSRKRETSQGRPCTSQYKGVSWNSREKKWRARITAEGREVFLGRFDHEIDAAEAYDEAARKFFGEHAWLNFPDDGSRNVEEAALARAA